MTTPFKRFCKCQAKRGLLKGAIAARQLALVEAVSPDAMVDIAVDAGSLGAQIAGAGMGGSMMALVADEAVNDVIAAMHEQYYVPSGIDDNVVICDSIQGVCIL